MQSRVFSPFSTRQSESYTRAPPNRSSTHAMLFTPPRSHLPTSLDGSSAGSASTAERSWSSSAKTFQLNISAKYLRPGFAFGGSCLPKDLRSLLHLARSESIDIPLLSATLASNRLSIDEAIDRVVAGKRQSGRPPGPELQTRQRRPPREPLRRPGREPARQRLRGPHLRPALQPLVPRRRQPPVRRIQTSAPEAHSH